MIEVIQGQGVGIRVKSGGWGCEAGAVTQAVGEADFIELAVEEAVTGQTAQAEPRPLRHDTDVRGRALIPIHIHRRTLITGIVRGGYMIPVPGGERHVAVAGKPPRATRIHHPQRRQPIVQLQRPTRHIVCRQGHQTVLVADLRPHPQFNRLCAVRTRNLGTTSLVVRAIKLQRVLAARNRRKRGGRYGRLGRGIAGCR